MLKIQLRHSTDDIILYSLGNTHDKSSLPEEEVLLSSGVAPEKAAEVIIRLRGSTCILPRHCTILRARRASVQKI
jgi:hypothetical protein